MLLTNRRFQIAARPKLNTTDGNTDGDVVDVGSICALCKYSVRRNKNFGTLDSNFKRQSNTSGSPSLAGTQIVFIPDFPKFSARNP